jgi:hypothetical protein
MHEFRSGKGFKFGDDFRIEHVFKYVHELNDKQHDKENNEHGKEFGGFIVVLHSFE